MYNNNNTASARRSVTEVTFAIFTLIAFSANSLLCRVALGGHLIDPVSFTTLRLVSGTVGLIIFLRIIGTPKKKLKIKGSWGSGFALFIYAIAFSLAYVSLSAGMGSLILFGSVQVTMIGMALRSGENLEPTQWIGLVIAICGLVYIVMPGISSPDPFGALLMSVSGVAWGVYSIRGKGVSEPVAMTAKNFTCSAPMTIIASAIGYPVAHLKPFGIILALISGIIASGLGYVIWYNALRGLTISKASVIQLIVPVLTAFGGVAFLSEKISIRLITASIMILGGVALVVLKKH